MIGSRHALIFAALFVAIVAVGQTVSSHALGKKVKREVLPTQRLATQQAKHLLMSSSSSTTRQTPVGKKEFATRRRPMLQTGSAWPKFHGNLNNTGFTTNGVSNGSPRWNTATNAAVEASPVIGSDGTVYVGSTDGFFYALNSSDGSIKWTNSDPMGFVVSSAAIGASGTLYFGCNDSNLYAVNSSDGTTAWTYATGAPITSSPTVAADGTIYVGSWDGNLYAVSSTGSLVWQFTTALPVESSPAIGADGTVYFGSDDKYVYALNPDGTLKWQTLTAGGVSSSPAIGRDGTVYVGSSDSNIYALDRATGTVKWTFVTGGPVTSSPAVAPDSSVIVGSTDNFVYRLRGSDGNMTWSSQLGDQVNSSPAIGGDGTIYVGCDDHNVYALSIVDGSQIWSAATGNKVISSPAISADGSIYVGSLDDNVWGIGSELNTIPVSSVTVNPTSIVGGQTSVGTVTLTAIAPYNTDIVQLQCDNPNVFVPSFVVVQSGSSTVNFSIHSLIVSSSATATITATSGGVNAPTTLQVQPLQPVSLDLSPSSILAGVTTTTGTVTLNGSAPVGGTVVTLTSQWPAYVAVPATCTVPAGSTTGTFTISSPRMWSIPFTDDVTATSGGVSTTTTLNVTTICMKTISVNPGTVTAGMPATCTINLWGPAPVGGWSVTLISGSPYFLPLPTTVTVPEGQTSTTFTVTPLKTCSTQTIRISAHDSVVWNSTNLSVLGDSLTGISVDPTTVSAGSTAAGSVSLKAPAPAGGWSVSLTTGVPSLVITPATIVIPEGSTTGAFNVTTVPTSKTLSCLIRATDATSTVSTTIGVSGNSLTGISVNPTSVTAGTTATGTVTIASPAATGGWTVNLTSGVPGKVSVPVSVIVPAGATSANFTVSTNILAGSLTVGIYGKDGVTSKSALLTVNGDSIAGFSINPTSVKGGLTSTGTITLLSPAPAGGWLVKVTVGVPGKITAPATVLVPAGSTTATFTLTTKSVNSSLTSMVAASDTISGQSTNLTITP